MIDRSVPVRVHRPAAFSRKLLRGSAGLATAYVDGDWDSDDLVLALRTLARTLRPVQRQLDRIVPRVRRRSGSPSSRARDQRQIRAHYDVSDEFFATLLDPTLAYSAAVFEHPGQSLEAAQIAKFDRVLRPLGLGPHAHLLEIGTGWGGLAIHAAATTGCRVTTTTVSLHQRDAARQRVAAAGLQGRVTVLECDWRDLGAPDGGYDAVVSVEMIEAVHWTELDAFLCSVSHLLRPGGSAAIQAIVIEDSAYERYKRAEREFIRTMVFPGGCIHSVGALRSAARRAGLEVAAIEERTNDYAETLARWQANLDAGEGTVRALGFDDRFLRLWRFYLAYCRAGFLEGRIGLVQVDLAAVEAPARSWTDELEGSPFR